MTRPEIIRADSIDLQDQSSPSAQDHSQKPTNPAPLGAGPPAPHQASTLREAALEAREENHRSPRVSQEWTSGEVQQLQQYGDDLAAEVTSKLTGANLQQQDDLAVAQNGGLTGSTAEDAEMADAEGDDGMDDDMMDKISSSPSIDDGGYSLPHLWPQRFGSFARNPRKMTLASQACCESSSPFVQTPDHFPLIPLPEPSDKDVGQGSRITNYHHLPGEYLDDSYIGSESNYEGPSMEDSSPRRIDSLLPHAEDYVEDEEDYKKYYDIDQLAEEFIASDLDLLNGIIQEKFVGQCQDEYIEEEYSDEEPEVSSTNDIAGLQTIPYESEEEEDDDYEIPFSTDSRYVDSGWGGECLQDIEDIDFEFVYALHTFVATVEGQANATKGDTMVLLDDSNSYWWLVRVVKDSSIGYLPAEHIETPTERLARLNKHRNIDLTSTMLGDQAEKSRNPLKIAIRRRNAKTVAFAPPQYFEASENEYSTDEEDMEGDYYGQNSQQEQNGDQTSQAAEEDKIAPVEPLKTRSEIREVRSESTEPEAKNGDAISKISSDTARTSDEIFEGKAESKSRNGTVRNTDSFFKDDTVETRKITLTPNLLRDDSSTSTRTSNESKELRQRPSLDKLDKDSPDKNKDKKDKKDKKEKDKKPGMLSGLFKRKEKKAKAIDDEIEEIMAGKRSTEKDRSSPSPSKDSEEIVEDQAPGQMQEVQRQPSKLQKQPRTEISPSRKVGHGRDVKASEPQQTTAPDRPATTDSAQAPTMRLVQPETSDNPVQARNVSPELTRGPTPVLSPAKEQKSGSSISKIIRSNSDTKPVKARRGKTRVELDDFDSSSDDSPVEEPVRAPSKQSQRPIPGSFPESYIGTLANERANDMEERLSESPVQVSPVNSSYPPPLMVDTSSQEDPPSPVSSPSPELIDAEEAREKKGGSSTASVSTATWSDAHLRTFFDDDGDIKDLLVVVFDKSGVVPAGPDHPITGNLFREENAKLADITNRLDGMLGDWLARKSRVQASR